MTSRTPTGGPTPRNRSRTWVAAAVALAVTALGWQVVVSFGDPWRWEGAAGLVRQTRPVVAVLTLLAGLCLARGFAERRNED